MRAWKSRFSRRRTVKRDASDGVWIVSQGAELDNQILGVFATEDEAVRHAEVMASTWPDGSVLWAHYPLGWDGNASRYVSTT